MKCAVAIVLALIGMVVTSPIAPLGHVAIASPVLLPSAVSVSSSVINHGVTIPKVIVPVAQVISAPVYTVPLIKTQVSAWPAWSGYGWGSWGLGKGWH